MKEPIQILLLVWNRREYTEMTLESVLRCTTYPFQLTVIDNASDPPTADFLAKWVQDHAEVVRSYTRNPVNEGLSPPTQRFWDQMLGEGRPWWGKIDNDIIFSPGWLERLVEVMEKSPKTAVASVCHYPRDFEREAKKGGIVTEGGISIFPRSHTGGCGYLVRAEAVRAAGKLSDIWGKMFGWSEYQHKLNRLGWFTAYAYPLVPVEHLGAWEGQKIRTTEYEDYAAQVKKFRVDGQAEGREKLSRGKKK